MVGTVPLQHLLQGKGTQPDTSSERTENTRRTPFDVHHDSISLLSYSSVSAFDPRRLRPCKHSAD